MINRVGRRAVAVYPAEIVSAWLSSLRLVIMMYGGYYEYTRHVHNDNK